MHAFVRGLVNIHTDTTRHLPPVNPPNTTWFAQVPGSTQQQHLSVANAKILFVRY